MAQHIDKLNSELIYPSGRLCEIKDRYISTSLTELMDKEVVIPASSTTTIYDSTSASETINSFSYVRIKNTGSSSIDVEYTVDKGGEVKTGFYTRRLPANAFDIVFSNTGYAGDAASSGTYDLIEEIKVIESEGNLGSIHIVMGG